MLVIIFLLRLRKKSSLDDSNSVEVGSGSGLSVVSGTITSSELTSTFN